MGRRLGVAAALGSVLVGAPLAQPTERNCLLAWNASSNQANRARLVTAARAETALSLRAGESFTDTWTNGAPATQTSTQVCLLTLENRTGKGQIVTGTWNGGRVTRWSWGRAGATARPSFPNVKLLPDGRVTKRYRR